MTGAGACPFVWEDPFHVADELLGVPFEATFELDAVAPFEPFENGRDAPLDLLPSASSLIAESGRLRL